jgi:hypothetical protein
VGGKSYALHNFYSILIHPPELSGSLCQQSHLVVKRNMGEEMAAEFCQQSIYFHACRFFSHAVNLRLGTSGFTSPLKEVMLQIFITLFILGWV